MTVAPSDAWFGVFPAPRIPDVLAYLEQTWDWLRHIFPDAVAFQHDEPTLTDNLCEALADRDRKFAHRMDCDFQAETWELRRASDGTTTRLARADIRVILGAPGTPHLVIEFKKLDGSVNARWRYCFEGMSRFVGGKYAVGHAFGVMCGFSPSVLETEEKLLSDYIRRPECASKLSCISNASSEVITVPSATDSPRVSFDTSHCRTTLPSSDPITLLHMLIACPTSASPIYPAGSRSPRKKRS